MRWVAALPVDPSLRGVAKKFQALANTPSFNDCCNITIPTIDRGRTCNRLIATVTSFCKRPYARLEAHARVRRSVAGIP
jgi:hypothetical protein